MNGKFVLDTNTIIYHLQGLTPWSIFLSNLPAASLSVSIITRMELLAWDGLTLKGERQIRTFLDKVNIAPLDHSIENEAIALRRNTRLKLPDAIVAATAVILKAALVTNDRTLASLDWLDLKVVIPT